MRQAVHRCPEPRIATPGRQRRNRVRPGVRRRFHRRATAAPGWPRRADTDRTARPLSRNRHRRCVRAPVNAPGCRTPRRTPPQRSQCRWPLCGTSSVTDRRCGTGGHLLSAERPADRRSPAAQRPAAMTIEAAAEGPQRSRPGGGNGTGCRTPDRSRSHPARTPQPARGHPGDTEAGHPGHPGRTAEDPARGTPDPQPPGRQGPRPAHPNGRRRRWRNRTATVTSADHDRPGAVSGDRSRGDTADGYQPADAPVGQAGQPVGRGHRGPRGADGDTAAATTTAEG
jgi:hypothetical protein